MYEHALAVDSLAPDDREQKEFPDRRRRRHLNDRRSGAEGIDQAADDEQPAPKESDHNECMVTVFPSPRLRTPLSLASLSVVSHDRCDAGISRREPAEQRPLGVKVWGSE